MKYKVMDEKGRSMIEMLGVLAIVGVLSVAGIAGYSKAMAKYKINKAMDQVSTLAANTKTLFAAVGSYAGLGDASADVNSNTRAYNLGLFPEDMIKGCASAAAAASGATSCVRNGLNGKVTIVAVKGAVDGDTFSIKFEGLTKDACTALITSDWGGAAGFRGLQGTKGSGNTAIVTGSSVKAYTPADLAAGVYGVAKTECTAADNTNTVTWYFY